MSKPDEPLDFQVAEVLIEVIPRIMRRIRNEMRKIAQKDLTIAQLRILSRLYQGTSTVSELADHHGVSTAAMSKMVSHLDTRELVEKGSNGPDRREVAVALTTKGKQTFLSIRRAVRGKVAEDMKLLERETKESALSFLIAMERLYRF